MSAERCGGKRYLRRIFTSRSRTTCNWMRKSSKAPLSVSNTCASSVTPKNVTCKTPSTVVTLSSFPLPSNILFSIAPVRARSTSLTSATSASSPSPRGIAASSNQRGWSPTLWPAEHIDYGPEGSWASESCETPSLLNNPGLGKNSLQLVTRPQLNLAVVNSPLYAG
jgi:hypothetical protein